MFDLTTYVKKWQIRQLKTVFSTLDTLCTLSIGEMFNTERSSGYPTLLFHQRASEVSEYYGETSDVCKEGVGSSPPSSDPPPVFETADDKSGSNGRGSLPLPAITNHYHHRPHPFTEGKLTQKLNFPSVSGSLFVSGLALQ